MYLEDYAAFEEWCEENNFNTEEYDREEESYKRDLQVYFYVKHNEKDVYREVSGTQSYDWGFSNIEIGHVDLVRSVRQVVTEKVMYSTSKII